MKEEYKEQLKKIENGGTSPESFNKAVITAFKNELESRNLTSDQLAAAFALADVLTLPSRPFTDKAAVAAKEKAAKTERLISTASSGITGLMFGILATLIWIKFGALAGVLVGFIAIVAIFFVIKLSGNSKCDDEESNETGLVSPSEPDAAKQIAIVCDKISSIAAKPAEKAEKVNTETTFKPLHKDFPNVVTWLSDVYDYSENFEDKARSYVRRRIGKLLGQEGYEIVSYDGTNQKLFETEVSNLVKEPVTACVSVVQKKTQKLVVVGKLFLPDEK